MKSSKCCCKTNIPYEVQYSNRKTIEIAVHPDGRVFVKAPAKTTSKTIQDRVLKRTKWITEKIGYFRQFEPKMPTRLYVGGETHLFLGRQYRLKIIAGKRSDVKLKGAFFYVTTLDPNDSNKVKKLLYMWYRNHGRSIFEIRLGICLKTAQKLNLPTPKILLRKLKKRWGSCTKTGYILLNTDLIKTPLYCIDYVIMHELCHIKIARHNKKYYQTLSKYMPDWGKRKLRLENAMI